MSTRSAWTKRVSKDRRDSPTRHQILDAAERVFSSRGFKATPISAITDEAGVSRATFYVYFSSREEVLRALAARFRDEVAATQRSASRLGSTPDEVIEASIRAALAVYARHAPLVIVIEHQALTDPEVESMWREIRIRSERVDAAFIAALSEQQRADPVTSPTAIAELIGAGLVRFAHGSLHQSDDADRMADELITMYRRLIGLQPQPGTRADDAASAAHAPARSARAGTTETRLRILDAAEQEFARRGYAGTSMVDLAAAAGVSRPTLYSYFGTRYDVLQGASERVRDAFLEIQERAGRDPHETLVLAARAYFQNWLRHYGILVVIEQQAMSDPEFAPLLDDVLARMHRRHADYLARLREHGLAEPRLEPARIAESFTGAVRQLAQAVRSGRTSAEQGALDAAQLLLTLANPLDGQPSPTGTA